MVLNKSKSNVKYYINFGFCYFWLMIFIILLIITFTLNFNLVCFILSVIALFLFLFHKMKCNKYKPEHIKQNEEKIKKQHEEYRQIKKEKEKERKANNEIAYTMIVGNNSTKSASSAIVRGAVGGALLGPVGLVGGALSGTNKNTTTFILVYVDGRKESVTVKTGGLLYNLYIQLLR